MKAVCFDFGNVIGFFDHHRATRRLAAETGLPEDWLYRQLLDEAREDAYESGQISSADFLKSLSAACRFTNTIPDELLGEGTHREGDARIGTYTGTCHPGATEPTGGAGHRR